MGLLLELQSAVAGGHNLSVPEFAMRFLREKVPLLSQMAAAGDPTPVAASEDYLLSKAVIPLQGVASLVKFLPLRGAKAASGDSTSSTASSSQGSAPSSLLVVAREDGTVELFAPAGEMVHSFSTGHEHPVSQLATSLTPEEHVVVTGDTSGEIRAHKVTVRQQRPSKEKKKAAPGDPAEEKTSPYLKAPVNITTLLLKRMQITATDDGVVPRMTALAMASQGKSTHFVAGDAEGGISVFSKNGTLRGRIDAAPTPDAGVEGLHAQQGNVVWWSGGHWGHVEPEKLRVRHAQCEQLEGRIAAVAVDSQQASRTLLADSTGTVWIFTMSKKGGDQACILELKLARDGAGSLDLASIKGFALGLERATSPGQQASLLAFNVSQVGKRRGDTSAPPKSVAWRRNRPSARSWAVSARQQQGSLLAFLSEDGGEVEIMELLMAAYTPPPGDDFIANFGKFPIVLVTMVMVLAWQFMKQKGSAGKKKVGLGGKDSWPPPRGRTGG
jgi:hypothetical protein